MLFVCLALQEYPMQSSTHMLLILFFSLDAEAKNLMKDPESYFCIILGNCP
jgi:hypothetical protein